MHWIRALAIWIVIIAVEAIHGVLRNLFLQPVVGDLHARQIGVLVGGLLILIVACLFGRWLNETSARPLLIIGLVWVVLTVAFEVSLGRFVLNLSWERILSDYDVFRGGLMPLGLAFLALAPLIASRLRSPGSLRS